MTRTFRLLLAILFSLLIPACGSIQSAPENAKVTSGNIAIVFTAADKLQLKKVGLTQIAYQKRTANIASWGLNSVLSDYAKDTLNGVQRFDSVQTFPNYDPHSIFQKVEVLNQKIDYVLVIQPDSEINTRFGTLSSLKGIGVTETSTLGGSHKAIGQVVLSATLYDAKSGKVMLSKTASDRWFPNFKLDNSLKLNQQQTDDIYSNTIPVGKSVVHQLLRQLQLIP